MQTAGMVFHYVFGVGWGPVYCLMRHTAGMGSLGAGVAAGMSMSINLDELVTPAAHVRGLLGHLVYGLALAGTAEVLYRLAGPGGPDQQT